LHSSNSFFHWSPGICKSIINRIGSVRNWSRICFTLKGIAFIRKCTKGAINYRYDYFRKIFFWLEWRYLKTILWKIFCFNLRSFKHVLLFLFSVWCLNFSGHYYRIRVHLHKPQHFFIYRLLPDLWRPELLIFLCLFFLSLFLSLVFYLISIALLIWWKRKKYFIIFVQEKFIFVWFHFLLLLFTSMDHNYIIVVRFHLIEIKKRS
jgi:hypothetical protein